MSKSKSGVVTFKVSDSLMKAMRGIPNRSEFIRSAVLTALDSTCPLCSGTGILTPDQKRHWEELSDDHSIEECADCHEMYIVCGKRRK